MTCSITSAIVSFGLRTALVACMSQAGLALAAELPDPTRPPATQRRAVATEQVAAAKAPVLQSVLTGAGRKPAVIISGQALEVGDTFEGMRLTRVTEAGAVLVGPHGTTTLSLTTGVEKLMAEAPHDAPVVTANLRPRGTSTASITLRMADTK